MVRTYERRKYPGRGRGRMLRAVQLRAEGKSLRQIGSDLRCSHQTVANDLARWDAESRLSKLPVKKLAPGATLLTAEVDSAEASVIPLRRTS
jgi:hypothetical protein